jgi:hypothetical protein
MNAINTREENHRIAAAALLRHDPSETEGVDFFDEIADDGSIISPEIVAAADRNGMTPAELCELVADAEEDKCAFNALRGYSAAERRTILIARRHGEDDIELVRSSRRRTH